MAWEDAGEFVERLGVAASTYDRESSTAIAAELIGRLWRDDAPFPLAEARSVLESLRGQRLFDSMRRVAGALIETGQSATRIRRQYAQALIEQRDVTSAKAVLTALAADPAVDLGERTEALGLLGRLHKQLYVDSNAPGTERARALLDRAVAYYHGAYEKDPNANFWHGVNCVALLLRAARDRIALDGYPAPRALAATILAGLDLERLSGQDLRWGWAAKAEACLALDDLDEAARWLARYAGADGVTAFELGSTHRQLVEVWQIDMSSETGRRLLPILRDRLLRLGGAELELSARDAAPRSVERIPADSHFEKVLGDTDFVGIHRYRLGLVRCRAVARVERRIEPDRGFGSGFLVRGRDLGRSLGDTLVLVTNAHVVSPDESVKGALRPAAAQAAFHALGDDAAPRRLGIGKVLWSSLPEELDTTILELDGTVEDVEPYPIAGELPLTDGSQRVYIIGHPRGGGLSFSIADNRLLDHQAPLLHYRAPTEGGSSGSPVFNQDWELIGIHHAGGTDIPRLNGQPGRYAANEGIWIQSVREKL